MRNSKFESVVAIETGSGLKRFIPKGIYLGFLVLVCFFSLTISCNHEEEIFSVYHVESWAHQDKIGYQHYLLLKNDGLSNSSAIAIAKKYIDTIHRDKPVYSITFLTSTKHFSKEEENRNWFEIAKDYNVELFYDCYDSASSGLLQRVVRYRNGRIESETSLVNEVK